MTVRRALALLALIAVAALAVAIYRFNTAAGGAPISGETRAGFVKSGVEACLALQKASPDNASVKPETITAYCDCYADALANRVTTLDLDRLRGKSAAEMQGEMRAKMEASETSCMAKLANKP